MYFGEFELKVRKRAPLWQAGGGHGTPRLGRPGLRHCEPTLSSRLRSPEREGEVGPNEREPASEKLAVLSSNLDQPLANNKSYSGCLRRPQSGWATHATDEREPASEKLAVLSSNFDQGLTVCQKKVAALTSRLRSPEREGEVGPLLFSFFLSFFLSCFSRSLKASGLKCC